MAARSIAFPSLRLSPVARLITFRYIRTRHHVPCEMASSLVCVGRSRLTPFSSMPESAPELSQVAKDRVLKALSTSNVKERVLTPSEIKAVALELLKAARG